MSQHGVQLIPNIADRMAIRVTEAFMPVTRQQMIEIAPN
jgi:hypothetical protein